MERGREGKRECSWGLLGAHRRWQRIRAAAPPCHGWAPVVTFPQRGDPAAVGPLSGTARRPRGGLAAARWPCSCLSPSLMAATSATHVWERFPLAAFVFCS